MRIDQRMRSLGFEPFADLSSAKGLDSPSNAVVAEIQAIGEAIRWRDDGTDPTAAIGHVIPDGKTFRYIGELKKFKMISATATASVTYYAPE